MSMKKKTKGKSKGTAKKTAKKKASAKTRAPSKKKGKDIVQVRENINELVKDSAKDIATEVIKVAKTGQLASAKYLFEAAGIYPATEQTTVNPIERSLAHTLLTRMGLPLDPVICDEEPIPAVLPSGAKNKCAETNALDDAEEDPGGERQRESAVPENEQRFDVLGREDTVK
ncbi:MAG: hypothetical protein WAM13_06095 [Candidatus Sulfotelmatobacter sp.]